MFLDFIIACFYYVRGSTRGHISPTVESAWSNLQLPANNAKSLTAESLTAIRCDIKTVVTVADGNSGENVFSAVRAHLHAVATPVVTVKIQSLMNLCKFYSTRAREVK